MNKPDFSNINSPMKQKTDRPVPNTMTTDSHRTSMVNLGTRDTNARPEWGNELESLQQHKGAYKPDRPTITRSGHPSRPIINHAEKVSRDHNRQGHGPDLHKNMGTTRAGHSYPGRRK
jgi:hypothetical protein